MSASGSAAASSSSLSFTTPPLIPCKKLVGASNYAGWAAAVELWFEGQGREDHLFKQYKNIPSKDQASWKQVDASLCSVLWYSIDAKLQAQFRSFKTCYDVWAKAKKTYSYDVNRLYKVVSDLISMKKEDMDMQSYVGKLDSLILILMHLCLLRIVSTNMLNNVENSSWCWHLSVFHRTLTPFAIKFCLVLMSPHMTLFASSYCVSQLLL
jgi:hypothetical protein